MTSLKLLLLSCSLLGMLPARTTISAVQPTRTMWTGSAGAYLYSAPSLDAPVSTLLPGNQPVRITANGPLWGRTFLWNALVAWVRLQDLRAAPLTVAGLPTGSAPNVAPPPPSSDVSLSANAQVVESAYLRAAPSFSAAHLALLAHGTIVQIDSWATDHSGAVWYHGHSGQGSGWIYGSAVLLDRPVPSNKASLLAPMRGSGMWFTYALLQHSPASAIITAARVAHLSHIYVEVGRSSSGFYGGPGLDQLLPVAHHAGIKVIVWVYPTLINMPHDVAMSVTAAHYSTPSGDHPDGLLADVETRMSTAAVGAYGQIMRTLLGPNTLMAIATYPPQRSLGQSYPFAIAARSWDVIVPMDYWHVQRRAYGATEVYKFVRESISLIRARTTPDQPIEVLGQMYDPFQSGVNNPSAAEIKACAAAARDGAAIGVSFFEWNHATPEEWDALGQISADM